MGILFIEIDGIQREYLLERKETKTIIIKVYPNLSIKVIAPTKVSKEAIQKKLIKRKKWIKKYIDYYSKYLDKQNQGYISGSTIYYLGKQFRLKIIESPEETIKLVGGYLIVKSKKMNNEHISALIELWYRNRASIYYYKIMEKCLKKLIKYQITQPIVFIRKMKTRWGSCNQNKMKITLNLNLVKESSLCIEYVIMHELCHLKFQNHSKEFYAFLSMVMPDWTIRKRKLEKLGM